MVGSLSLADIGVCPEHHTLLHGGMMCAPIAPPMSPPNVKAPERRPPALRPTRRRSPTPVAGQRTPLTPESWIEAATQVLVDQGIDHVRVDVLATQLAVTRGSFYWHFRDREDLLRRVLQAWRESATEQLTRRLENASTDPREQLQDVISLPFRGRAAVRAARIELAIRAWARRDEMARLAVDEADAARIAYHTQVFAALGFAPVEAAQRAFVLYGYEVAESMLSRQGSAAQKQARRAFMLRLAMQPLPD
jgi:AcrR family transcriptional regulator